MEGKKYDIVVLGGGPGGYVSAIRAGQLRKKTLLIEKEKLGGVCLNAGCIPTKALLYVTEIYEKIKNSQNLGIEAKELKIDIEILREWKEGIIKKLSNGVMEILKGNGVEIIKGKGRIVSPSKLIVEMDGGIIEVEAENIILATGSSPLCIKGLSFDKENIWTSTEALELKNVPKRLLIIGGGYVGIEIATIYQRLGRDVNIIEIMDQILPEVDKDLVQVLSRSLKDKGVTIWTETIINNIKKKEGSFIFELKKGDKEFVVDTEKVLVVVGRKPNIDGIGLETLHIDFDENGFIDVDDTIQTRVKGIFAVGDLTGQPLLAHKASKEGEIAAEVAAGKPSSLNIKVVPSIIFSSPQIGIVGLTENEAKRNEIPYKKGKFPYSASGRAHCENDFRGFVKILAEPETNKILGVSAVGSNVESIISEATLAIEMGATLEDIARVIHTHPTISENLMESAKNALGEAIHIFNK